MTALKLKKDTLKKQIRFSPNTFSKIYYRDCSEAEYENNDNSYNEKLRERLKNFADYQYIIERNDTIIYIATTPSHRSTEYRNYFFRNLNNQDDKSRPNAYYFNTFLIGKKIKKGKDSIIIFRDDKNEMRWKFFNTNDKLDISAIDIFTNKYKRSSNNYIATISPSQSIDIGFKFRKMENFKNFFYSDTYKVKDFKEQLPALKEIVLEYDDKNKLYQIIINFSSIIRDGKNAVVYPKSRIKYSNLNNKNSIKYNLLEDD